ncbi:MAG: CsgG/HfaB family protein [Hyphomicrobiaceae bacterium]
MPFEANKFIICAGAILSLTGCVAGAIQDRASRPAELLPMTQTGFKTETLPPPAHAVKLAVYEIKDKTGQHKPNDAFAEYSRAVTQAGTAILTDVLKKTGDGRWFRVLEREGIKDVIQERNIHNVRTQLHYKQRHLGKGRHPYADSRSRAVDNKLLAANHKLLNLQSDLEAAKRRVADLQSLGKAPAGSAAAALTDAQREVFVTEQQAKLASSRLKVVQLEKQLVDAQASKKTATFQQAAAIARAKDELAKQYARQLPALPHSNIIIKGAITGYDSNETTGGLGARLLAIGGDGQYRRDIVTVSLRAIDVRSGEVLVSVTSTKTIYSKALNAQTFQFVAVDKILEIEAGVTRNEIPSLAVRHAFELAVFSLIAEGVNGRLWQFADPDMRDKVLAHYEGRYANPRRDVEKYVRDKELLVADGSGRRHK